MLVVVIKTDVATCWYIRESQFVKLYTYIHTFLPPILYTTHVKWLPCHNPIDVLTPLYAEICEAEEFIHLFS